MPDDVLLVPGGDARRARRRVDPDAFADAVVLAGGTGERMQVDKLMLEVAGLPLLAWTLRAVAAALTVRRVIVVARDDRAEELLETAWLRDTADLVVVGGDRRQDSVANGVAAATGEVVLIHDGARPLVTPHLLDAVALAAREHGAAVPVAPVPESMRRVVDGRVVEIIDRHGLFRSQTPHGARVEVLRSAYEHVDPHGEHTYIDETTLVQAAGVQVATVPGEQTNLKVTLPGDEVLAFGLLQERADHPQTYPWLSVDGG